MRRGFHILRDGDRVTLARRLPARLDFCATTTCRLMSRERLAQLIRQDLWRALRRVRGFSPVVEVTRHAEHLAVRAGGQVDGPLAPTLVPRAQAVLDDPANRHRWFR